MQKSVLVLVAVSLMGVLSGCLVVKDRRPEQVRTTSRQTTVTTPAATTVERTTVY